METTVQAQLSSLYPQGAPCFAISSDEDYILTRDEEAQAVEAEVTQLRQLMLYRLCRTGLSAPEALDRVRQVPWEEWLKYVDHPALFQRVNSLRHQERWHKSQRDREVKEKEQKEADRKRFWTAKQFYRFMAWNSERSGRPLVANDQTLPLIKALCFFLSRDERFETELNYSFKKGLWIRGTSGLGKTHLVNCVRGNELNPIKVLPVLEVMDGVRHNGEYNIGTDRIIYLDDVGTETSPIKYFGSDINWVKDFIENSYTGNRPFNRLMFSSNLSFDEVEAKYGYRVRSRLKEMVNVVEVEGEDMRR